MKQQTSPPVPEGWTYLIHGSSMDRWDSSLLGTDFTVGRGQVAGHWYSHRPLCCVERSDARFQYARDGSNTARTYGGKEAPFELRVLLPKDPRSTGESCSEEDRKDLFRYYSNFHYRHPIVPAGTELRFLEKGTFDEVTNTDGHQIYYYVPERYANAYEQALLPDLESSLASLETGNGLAEDNFPSLAGALADLEPEPGYLRFGG